MAALVSSSNTNLEIDAATLPFVIGSKPTTDSDPYLGLQSNDKDSLFISILIGVVSKELLAPDNSQLFYHINRLINVYCLCIFPSVAPDILAITHDEGHTGFSCCYKMITRS